MLTEKYKPQTIDEFCGLEAPKKIIGLFACNPQEDAFLFWGPSGTGKTVMAFTFARAIGAEIVHIPSCKLTAAVVDELREHCQYRPMYGEWRVIIADEVNEGSDRSHDGLISLLDGSGFPPQTIFIFTCNAEKNEKGQWSIPSNLEPRLLSRLKQVKFSTYGINGDGSRLLQDVWRKEGGAGPEPDFERILNDNAQNIRAALNAIELKLMEGE